LSLQSVNRPLGLLARRLLKLTLSAPLRWRTGLRVDHPERLPTRRQPLVLACNHAAFTDTVYLSVAMAPRFVLCGAKPRLFRDRRRRAVMAIGNIQSVDDHPSYLAECAMLLQQGELLLTYPEMGRFPDGLGEFSTWPAEVALAAGVPVLPMYLHGTSTGHQRPVQLRVGKRLDPRGSAQQLTDRMRTAIVGLGQL